MQHCLEQKVCYKICITLETVLYVVVETVVNTILYLESTQRTQKLFKKFVFEIL